MELEWISDARITAPLGWSAGAVWAEMKTYGPEPRLDLGLLVSERPCSVAGVFTQNRVCGAPVVVTTPRSVKISPLRAPACPSCGNATRLTNLEALAGEAPADLCTYACSSCGGQHTRTIARGFS